MTWRERIVEARTRGFFSPEDADQAMEWTTCAVGEWRAQYPAELALFQDKELRALGACFGGLVSADASFPDSEQRFEQVEQMLEEIAALVLRLKREAGS